MDVVDDADQCGRVLHQSGLVPALKEMSALLAKPIEPGGKRALQPMHTRDQIWLGSFERKVEVVGQESIRVQSPRMELARFGDRGFESLRGSDGCEDITAIVAPVDDVVERSPKLNSQSSSHAICSTDFHPSRPHSPVPNSWYGVPVPRRTEAVCEHRTA